MEAERGAVYPVTGGVRACFALVLEIGRATDFVDHGVQKWLPWAKVNAAPGHIVV